MERRGKSRAFMGSNIFNNFNIRRCFVGSCGVVGCGFLVVLGEFGDVCNTPSQPPPYQGEELRLLFLIKYQMIIGMSLA
jgi:hypothetical protein